MAVAPIRSVDSLILRNIGWLATIALFTLSCLVPVERVKDPKSAKKDTKSNTSAEGLGSSPSGSEPEGSGNMSSSQPKDEKGDDQSQSDGNTGDEDTVEDFTDEPNKKCEEGRVRECFKLEDGTPIQYPGGVPQGSCVPGHQKCVSGEWGICEGAVEPAKMDTCEKGNDDNCNGRPNDHCKCSVGETEKCGINIGACEYGKMICKEDGFWGDCEGNIEPSEEVCDGKIDQDCDGKKDVDEEDCECINGSTDKECGSKVGACKKGHYVCEDGKWGSDCIGEVGPTKEVCDGRRDDDCDGRPDSMDPDCECLDDGKVYECTLPYKGDCKLGVKKCRNGKWGPCEPRFTKKREFCGVASDKYGQGTGDEDCDGHSNETDQWGTNPSGCSFYMIDEDRDGFGKMGPQFGAASRPTWGCFCPGSTSLPSGWVEDSRNTKDSDCGDCRVGGAAVTPEVTDFFDKPNVCLQSLYGRLRWFDYDCSGSNERENKQPEATKCELINGVCTSNGYWSDSLPDCGEAGTVAYCIGSNGKCHFQGPNPQETLKCR